MAGLGTGVTDGSSGIDAAGAGDGAGARHDGFEKCGFTALEWAHQRDAPWTSGTSDVLSHSPPPQAGARPVIGSADGCSACPEILASQKNVAAVRGGVSLNLSRSLRGEVGACAQAQVPGEGQGTNANYKLINSRREAPHPALSPQVRGAGEESVTAPAAVPGFPIRPR